MHLSKFLDSHLTHKQIQQFLGIVNYVSEFVLKLSKSTKPLYQMLKKDPLVWSKAQTRAIQKLKSIILNLPLLQIPSLVPESYKLMPTKILVSYSYRKNCRCQENMWM